MSAGAVRAGKAYVEIGARDRTQKVLRSMEKRLRSFGAVAGSVGRSMVGIGGVGAAGIGAAVGILAGFDQKMAAVAAKTGAVGAPLDALRDKAKELGATTRFSAAEAAAGMEYLAQAGFNTEQILASIPDVLALAAAGGIDLGMAADIASDVGQAFGLTADEIGRVSDVLAKTATTTNTSVEGLGETFKFVAPLAAATGQSIEEVSAAAGILGNSGVKASMAGTDLKNILVALSKPDSAAALEKLGVAITDADGEMRPMMDVLRDFGAATENMTGPEKLATSIDIFGKISGKSAIILSGAGDQVDTLRAQLDGAEGAAQQMATTMQDGIHGSLITAWSAVQGLAISVGEALKPALMSIIDAGTGVIRWATNFIDNNRGVAIAMTAVVGGMIAVGTGLITLGGLFAVAATVVGAVATVLSSAFLPPLLIAIAIAAALSVALAGVIGVMGLLVAKSKVLWPAIKQVGEKFLEMGRIAWDAVSVAAKALMSGKIGLAAKALWAGVRVIFWKGVRHAFEAFKQLPALIIKATANLQTWMVQTFHKTFAAIARGMRALAAGSATGVASAIRALVSSQTSGGEPPEFGERLQSYEDAAAADLADVKRELGIVDKTDVAAAAADSGSSSAAGEPLGTPAIDADIPDLDAIFDEARKEMAQDNEDVVEKVTSKIDPATATDLQAATEQGGGSTPGTTSAAAAALAAFTGDAATDRIAKASERQVELLEDINEDLKRDEFGGTGVLNIV